MTRALPPPLLTLSPGSLQADQVQGLVETVKSAVRAGARGLLLREPRLPDRELWRLAHDLREQLPELAWLGIHDRAQLAVMPLFDALHLGFRSLSVAEARGVVGPQVAIGFSAHADDQGSERHTADYLFMSPVFDTPSKRGRLAALGIDGLRQEVARSAAPVWALGGMRPEHCAEVLACGARGVAVLSGILGEREPARAAQAFLAALRQAQSSAR